MFITHTIRSLRVVALLALTLVLGVAAYGFAASNTVPSSGAGDGTGTVSGYTVGTPTYTLNSTNPANIDSVSFSITPASGLSQPTTVKAQLVANGSWFACTKAADPSTTWSCTTSGVTASAADQLRVVAAQ